MIFGAHAIIYSSNADADRAFLSEVLGFHGVDAGEGWLIFALPPAEIAVHPAESSTRHELYLMCDDLHGEIDRLHARGIRVGEVHRAPWGAVTEIALPGGGRLGLYEPRHPMAIPGPEAS